MNWLKRWWLFRPVLGTDAENGVRPNAPGSQVGNSRSKLMRTTTEKEGGVSRATHMPNRNLGQAIPIAPNREHLPKASPTDFGPVSPRTTAVNAGPLSLEPYPSTKSDAPAGSKAPLVLAESRESTAGVPKISFNTRNRRNLTDDQAASLLLRDAFTPTRPKEEDAHLAGRLPQIERILAAIEEERAHVAIFGERGTGKTSLSNVIAGMAIRRGYIVQRFACSSNVIFEDLFKNLLSGIPGRLARIPRTLGALGPSQPAPASLDGALPPAPFGPEAVLSILTRVSGHHLILMIDEYDRVRDVETRNKIAETLKNVSDAGIPVTFVLIGVAADVDDLLGKHPSLRRALVIVPLPLLSREEGSAIIANGEERLGITFAPIIRERILDLAPGLPYSVHLLCLFAARNAIRRRSQLIEAEDVRYAVDRCIAEAETEVKEIYNIALSRHGTSISLATILFAAAKCGGNEFGIFATEDVRKALGGDSETMTIDIQSALDELSEADRGRILRRVPVRDGFRYQFQTQIIRHYVLLQGLPAGEPA